MPRKAVRPRRLKTKHPSPVILSVEKIELDIVKAEIETIDLLTRIKRRWGHLLSDHSTLTKAEFVKYFVIPFCISFFILILVLFHSLASRDPWRIPSVHVRTSLHSVSDVLVAPLKLLGGKPTLQGQSVFDAYQVKMDIDKGSMSYVLLDIRSHQEFAQGHIRDAINVPTYNRFDQLPNLKLSESVVVTAVRKAVTTKKPVVVYGHTRDSQLTHDVVAILTRDGWEVSTLGVGWNEWRHFTNIWVPEAGWDAMQIDKYVDEEVN